MTVFSLTTLPRTRIVVIPGARLSTSFPRSPAPRRTTFHFRSYPACLYTDSIWSTTVPIAFGSTKNFPSRFNSSWNVNDGCKIVFYLSIDKLKMICNSWIDSPSFISDFKQHLFISIIFTLMCDSNIKKKHNYSGWTSEITIMSKSSQVPITFQLIKIIYIRKVD